MDTVSRWPNESNINPSTSIFIIIGIFRPTHGIYPIFSKIIIGIFMMQYMMITY